MGLSCLFWQVERELKDGRGEWDEVVFKEVRKDLERIYKGFTKELARI